MLLRDSRQLKGSNNIGLVGHESECKNGQAMLLTTVSSATGPGESWEIV